MATHTILGAGGVIGNELAAVLPAYADTVRLFSRHPRKVNPADELVTGDLTDAAAVDGAVAGAEVAYLTAGLPYRASLWEETWPRVMENAISACLKHDAALIFFDNIYCYGKVDGPITEACLLQASTRKGKVRIGLQRRLEKAWEKEGLKGAIVRAADFYGRGAPGSMLEVLVLAKYRQQKKAQWLCNDQVRYSMTYTPDAALGTALVGHDPDTWHQVWHLPTSAEAVTASALIALCAELSGVRAGHTLLNKTMLRMAGLFDPTVREIVEMTYQYQYPYVFDSGKFERRFHFHPTLYRDGLRQTIAPAAESAEKD